MAVQDQRPEPAPDATPLPTEPAGAQAAPFERIAGADVSLHESWLPKEHPLYRPRHPTQRLARICAVIFFVAPIAALAVFGQPPAIENHAVHQFPGLSQGWGFFTGLLPWAVDNLPFRQTAITVADGISRGLFGEPFPLGQGDDATGPLPAQQPPTTAPAIPGAPNDQTSNGYPEVVQGTDGWLYFGFDMQGKCEPDQPLTTVVGNLDRLRDAIQQSGRRFVLFVAPDKSVAEPQHLPADYAGKACSQAADKQFWQYMDDNVGAIDPRAEIKAAEIESGKPVYFRQDTHWNFTGGLIMTRELAEKIQPGVTTGWRVSQGPTLSGPADLPKMVAQNGTNSGGTYRLAPDGITDLDRSVPSDVLNPVELHDPAPVNGQVTAQTTMIDDSFSQYGSSLLAAAFANLTMVSQQTVASDPQAEANRLVNSQVVVIEIVERDLIGGVSPITTEQFVDDVSATLAAHPLRH